MKKIGLIIFVTVIGLSLSGVASSGMLIPAADQAKEKAKAPEKSSVITETETGNWDLERIDFIHYARPDNPGKSPKNPKEETCYKLLGVKWKSLSVDYVINPDNSGLSEEFVSSAISTSSEAWDDSVANELFNDSYAVDYTKQYGVQDFVNVLSFGDYADSNVIAVTSIWFTRKGKQIVEFDILFNTDFTWGDADINPALMDLQNIAIHELGHAVGLGDIYFDACSIVTMYGYSQEGEVEKRTLEQPDIDGINRLYGI